MSIIDRIKGDKRKPKAVPISDMRNAGISFHFPRGAVGSLGTKGLLALGAARQFRIIEDTEGREYALIAEVEQMDGKLEDRELDRFRDRGDAEDALEVVQASVMKLGKRRSISMVTTTAFVLLALGVGLVVGVNDATKYHNKRAAAAAAENEMIGDGGVADSSVLQPGVVPGRQAWQGNVINDDQRLTSIPNDGTWTDMAGLNKLTQITYGKEAPKFIAFSDPRCTACQEFDRVLAASTVPHAVIPVGALGQDSAILSAQVLCADDKAAAWKRILAGEQVLPQNRSQDYVRVCAEKSLANLKYFSEGKIGGRTATPTLIRVPDGRIHIGGFKSQEEIQTWLNAK